MKYLNHIAYKKIDGKSPGIVFCGGFRSDMEGSKAVFLEKLCKELGHSFIRFDYFGHGESHGDFTDGSIGQWKDDTLKVIDELTEGPQIIVGSSMGGWMALLAAIERPKKIKSLIGLAAAPDFTEDLMWETADEFSQKKLLRDGIIYIPNCHEDEEPYPITLKLIEEGRENLLLNGEIDINCPIRLLHGMADEDVPYEYASLIAEAVKSDDVEIKLIKDAGHRMSGEKELNLLRETLLSLL